jgi:hypothetical protein
MSWQVFVVPNPFTHQLEIMIEHVYAHTSDCIIQLTDENSKIVRMLGTSLREGLNLIPITSLHVLPIGLYYLDIKHTTGSYIYRTKVTRE